MKQTVKAYIAGIIDGEGYIGINRTKLKRGDKTYYNYVVKLEVHSSNERLCLWLQENCGGYFGKGNKPNGKSYYRWSIASKDVYKLLDAIFEFLVIKKEQALIISEYRKTLSDKKCFQALDETVRQDRAVLYEQLKSLHHVH